MSFVGVAIAGGVAGLGGAYLQSEAAKDAARTQADAANRASELQYKMYQQQRSDQEPWRVAGVGALSDMQNPDFQRDFTLNDFQKDPGYDFRMQEGQNALERSAAARGGLQSGGTLKELAQYGQNFASNEYNNAYNRFNGDRDRRFGRLSNLAGFGQNANSANAVSGQNYANNVGNNMIGAANAQGAAGMASANAWGGALSGMANMGMQGAMMGQQNKWMDLQQQKLNQPAIPPR